MPTRAEKNADMKFPAHELPRGEVLEDTCVVGDLLAKPVLQLAPGDTDSIIKSLKITSPKKLISASGQSLQQYLAYISCFIVPVHLC